jgi:hypothetical protein
MKETTDYQRLLKILFHSLVSNESQRIIIIIIIVNNKFTLVYHRVLIHQILRNLSYCQQFANHVETETETNQQDQRT